MPTLVEGVEILGPAFPGSNGVGFGSGLLMLDILYIDGIFTQPVSLSFIYFIL